MLKILSALIVVVSALPVLAQDLPAKDKFHLYLLVGQSNMAGRGKVTEADRKPHPRVLTMDKAGKWVPAADPIHFDKKSVGVGLGKTFGILAAEADPSITVGLIPCAAGGSPIDSWKIGGYHGQTKSHPYDDSIKRATAALKVGTLKGILWHQGESDAKPGKADDYQQKLTELVGRFRTTLQAPDVPCIIGQLGQFPERPWSDDKKTVDAAHRAIPRKLRNCAFVPSNGLTHKGDEVHFDAPSYREFGRRYARAFLELRP